MIVDNARNGAHLGGLPMKQITLALLTFQNSALILIMHYSRIMPLVGPQRYFASTAVFINEVLKFAISVTVALYETSNNLGPSTPATTLFSTLTRNMLSGDSWKLGIPAILYTFQNTLQYVAVSNLDAATFQVTYQLKILTTALFSVILLGRSLSGRKWISLVVLMLGVGIVQLPAAEVTTFKALKDSQAKLHVPRSLDDLRTTGQALGSGLFELMRRSGSYEGIVEDRKLQNPQLNSSVGLSAVVVACMLSGLAGVYFEMVLKDSSSSTSLWTRNVQLSFYSLFTSFFGVAVKDGVNVSKWGFFVGYNGVVWTAIIFQAAGGVIVALVVNYADNIAKNFATSISIVISFLASVWFFDMSITLNFVVGTALVLFATWFYSSEDQGRSARVKVAPFERTTVGSSNNTYEEQNLLNSPRTSERSDAFSGVNSASPAADHSHFRSMSISGKQGKTRGD